MRIWDLLQQGTALLEQANVPNYAADAASLLTERLQIPPLTLFTHYSDTADDTLCKQYLEDIRCRALRIPLQHIVGKAYFYGNTFLVNQHVLIPRQETELLCQEAIRIIGNAPWNVLDLCTGSGCIGITIAEHCKNANVSAIDISADALSLARENAQRLHQKVSFVQNDLLEGIDDIYDAILSNPPYIPRGELPHLQAEVQHDPMLALDGGTDGLELIRRIQQYCKKNLKKDGLLLMEIGHNQAAKVMRGMQDFYDTKVIPDLYKIDRFIFGRKK